jgi:hypothetical protein
MSFDRSLSRLLLRSLAAALVCAALPSVAPAQDASTTDTQVTDPATTDVPVLIMSVTGNLAAESTSVYSSVIRDNVIDESFSTRGAELVDSLHGNSGIVQVNQDVGSASNQLNLVAISISVGSATSEALADTSLFASAVLTGNTVTVGNATRTATISNILEGSRGIAQVNQNNGSLNLNLNLLAISLAYGPGTGAVSLGENALSATSSGNTFNITGPVTQTNTIANLGNMTGLAQINQTLGDGNVGYNAMSVSLTVVNQ